MLAMRLMIGYVPYTFHLRTSSSGGRALALPCSDTPRAHTATNTFLHEPTTTAHYYVTHATRDCLSHLSRRPIVPFRERARDGSSSTRVVPLLSTRDVPHHVNTIRRYLARTLNIHQPAQHLSQVYLQTPNPFSLNLTRLSSSRGRSYLAFTGVYLERSLSGATATQRGKQRRRGRGRGEPPPPSTPPRVHR